MERVRTHFANALSAIKPGQRLVVACSGGLDSIVLLHLVAEHFPVTDLVVAHLNHNQRGPASVADERLVKASAKKLGIAMFYAKLPGKTRLSEEKLRRHRREFLEAVAEEQGASFILTAHHGDDQAETFFFRLLRGTGLGGLQGIKGISGKYLRPLLAVTKSELEALAKTKGWKFKTDHSNMDTTYFRNRIRHQLMPVWNSLSESFGGEKAWSDRLGELLLEIQETTEKVEAQALVRLKLFAVLTPYWYRLRTPLFLEQDEFWQRATLRALFGEMGISAITRKEMVRLIAFIKKGKGQALLSNGSDAIYSQGFIFFKKRGLKPPVFSVPYKGKGWKVKFPPIVLELKLPKAGRYVLRSFQTGDQFEGKPLRKRLMKAKIPSPERDFYPVLAYQNSSDVVWHPTMKHTQKGPMALEAKFSFTFPTTWQSAKC